MKAWELLEKKGWCQHVYARNLSRIPVSADNESACSFCMLGAMDVANVQADGYLKLKARLKQFTKLSAESWNDEPGRTKEEVVALLKELDI